MNDMSADELIETFAANVLTRRLELAMTQAELAAKLGSKAPYVSNLERGRKSPHLRNLAKLAEALKTTPEALVRRRQKNSRLAS